MSKAATAIELARDIRARMIDLLTALDELADDESLTTQERHLVLNQACNVASENFSTVREYAATFLESRVEKCTDLKVEGMTFDGFYVPGMVYSLVPKHKVEILNTDDKSWGELLKLLVDAGLAGAIQKRLTVSKFVDKSGVKEDNLACALGMLNCYTEEVWSITKPKQP